ncbi:MAG: zf-HC2 domain-containing protein [Pirellulaceae bacterium]
MTNQQLCHHCDAWIDGDLSPDLSSAFKSHLIECESCRSRVLEWQQLEFDTEVALRVFAVDETQKLFGEGFATPRADVLDVATISPALKSTSKTLSFKVTAGLVAAVAIAAFAIGVSWALRDPPGNSTNADSLANHNDASDVLASENAKTLSNAISPPVPIAIDIKPPAIATSPVTYKQYTLVQVYSAFTSSDLEQPTESSNPIDRTHNFN